MPGDLHPVPGVQGHVVREVWDGDHSNALLDGAVLVRAGDLRVRLDVIEPEDTPGARASSTMLDDGAGECELW